VRGFTGRTRLGGVSTTSPTSEEVAEMTKRSAGTTSGVTGAAAGLTLFFDPFGRPAFRLVSSIPFDMLVFLFIGSRDDQFEMD